MYLVIGLLVILLVILLYILKNVSEPPSKIVYVNTPRFYNRQRTVPEFRGPPLKRYKPRNFQQFGILSGDKGTTLPLYGRESRTHRDRYHYYTTTQGEQVYPLTIKYADRDCTDDIGCQELYGNESISVSGNSENFKTNIYRTENFLDSY